MKSYSQSQEDLFILKYFNGYIGTLCDIGSNDGVTLSNSRLLIESGWKAHLVEPMREAYGKLHRLYFGKDNVVSYMCAIGNADEMVTLYANGEHLKKGDIGLLSTVSLEETKRWGNTETFTPETAVMRTYKSLFANHKFDFISIDAESQDVIILKQIDLTNTRALIIEWNSVDEVQREILQYCEPFGLYFAKSNAENLILTR